MLDFCDADILQLEQARRLSQSAVEGQVSLAYRVAVALPCRPLCDRAGIVTFGEDSHLEQNEEYSRPRVLSFGCTDQYKQQIALTWHFIFAVLRMLSTVKEFTETAVPTLKPGTADDS
jgi:hypothetical protein